MSNTINENEKKYASLESLRSFKENADKLYATQTSVDELVSEVNGKANSSHTHDDRYYTESEVNTLLANKSDSTHNHDSKYDASGSASSALLSAQTYTDQQIANKTQVQIITWEAND